jgi:hypothetical protein
MIRPTAEQVKELRQWALGFDRFDPVTPPSVADTTLALCDDWLAQDEALTRISEQQPKTLAMIRANGFVFDDIGREPGNWQHLAFTIYTDLCEIDSLARAALADLDASAAPDEGDTG